MNCGGCGFGSCKEFDEAEKKLGRDFVGPMCAFKALNLGIALGSAAKTASLLNVDNRVMYRVGSAAMKLKLLPDAAIIMGIRYQPRARASISTHPRQCEQPVMACSHSFR